MPVTPRHYKTVSILYPEMFDIGCISHFLDQVGSRKGLSTKKTKLNIEKMTRKPLRHVRILIY